MNGISYTSELRPHGADGWTGHGLRFDTEAEARRSGLMALRQGALAGFRRVAAGCAAPRARGRGAFQHRRWRGDSTGSGCVLKSV